MTNKIIEAVSAALNAEFGEGYEIYMEEIEQGLEEPCFLIQCLSPSSQRLLKGRYFRTAQFCIQYFPESRKDTIRECHDAGERLFSCLEWLDAGGSLKMGTKMEYKINDGVLFFFINYDSILYREEPMPPMETVDSKTTVKG